ncbi:ATP-binding protein [Tsukamurella sp. NPDC003166]|uniref:ATP-binding protein n=1 Tax=Tsukamurella sp. NPDC003166 TaxID=3154444 RepID=UPI0033A72FE4
MQWSAEHLQELLGELRNRGGDRSEVEVKRGAGGCPRMPETICAFANMPSGGMILVGIDEGAGFAATGVPDVALIEQGLAAQARNAVVPPAHIEFEHAIIDDRDVVVATIAGLPISDRPCRTRKGGHAYLRQADGDYRMSDQEIAQLIAQRTRPRYDASAVPNTSAADLDPRLVAQFVAEARQSSRRLADSPDETILRRRGVLATGTDKLSVAGLYALGQYPQQYFPSLSITAAVELSDSADGRTADLAHLDGPVPDLLEQAMQWVSRNTRRVIRYGGDGHGIDEDEIPMVAVRELIANALVHRDLGPHTIGKRVEIRLRDDLLVIANPGGLWGVTTDQLGTPAGKSAVNEFLYDICKTTRTLNGKRVIEGEGGGIREARVVLRAAGMPAPIFRDGAVRFTAILSRHSLLSTEDLEWLSTLTGASTLSDMQREILASMRGGQEWTNSLVRREFTPIDSIDARAVLQGLVSAGLAITAGDRGATTYSLAPALNVDAERTVPIVEVTPADDTVRRAEAGKLSIGEIAAITRNGRIIWDALAEPASLDSVVGKTGLTPSQASFALRKLAAAGAVVIDGGPGSRGTTYSRQT